MMLSIFSEHKFRRTLFELLVPLSERRHRLYTPKIPEVKRGLKLRLQEFYEAREDGEAARAMEVRAGIQS
jgi:hypothetical protein